MTEQGQTQEARGRTGAEWVTTAIAVALIALLCGAILYEGYVAADGDPARIEVETSTAQAEQRGGSWYVLFAVSNSGDETVEEIALIIELFDGDEVVAEAETTIALLGEDERITGMAVFAADPRPFRAEGRTRSFQIAEDG